MYQCEKLNTKVKHICKHHKAVLARNPKPFNGAENIHKQAAEELRGSKKLSREYFNVWN
jgi:hypothetical protein